MFEALFFHSDLGRHRLERSEGAAEGQLLLVVDVLVAQYQHGVAVHRAVDRGAQ